MESSELAKFKSFAKPHKLDAIVLDFIRMKLMCPKYSGIYPPECSVYTYREPWS